MPKHYCKDCSAHVEAAVDAAEGHSFCPACGLQLEDVYLESGPTFVQDGNFSHLAGTVVREEDLGREGATAGGFAGSRERSASKGKTFIRNFATQLDIPEAPIFVEQAARLYQLAMSSGFTRGRRVNQVAAACLYIVLRQDRRPYLLIDFCKLVNVNVYVLGSTYLRLSETLRLATHPVQVCLVDPSLYIHRFAGKLKLPQHKQSQIVNTSMHLIATMKRDWMQTGRRPAGVCGAALFLACHVHGEKVSRRDIIKVVSVGESTILHRIAEIKNTSASALTLEEFQEHARQCHQHQLQLEGYTGAEGEVAPVGLVPSGAKCRHMINHNAKEVFMGMCQNCFLDYAKSSGGIVRGAEDPPAYKRNLVKHIHILRQQANEEAIKLLTSRFIPGAPSSIAGGSISMGLPEAANIADVAEGGPSCSRALICHPGTGSADGQAGTSQALVCLPEAGKGLDAPGQSDQGTDVLPTENASSQDNVVGKGRTRQLTRRQATRKRAAMMRGSRRGIESDNDSEEWQNSEENSTESDDDSMENSKCAKKRKRGAQTSLPVKQRRGRPPTVKKGMGLDPSIEAEFALVLLENENVQEIVKTLQISNAELPAYNVQQARDLLAKSKDPLVEVQAAAAAEIQERNACMRAYERERAAYRANPEYEDMVLRSSRFLEIQSGADVSFVSEPVRHIITGDMHDRAADLAEQNAQAVEQEKPQEKARSSRKHLRFGGLLLEDIESAVNAEPEGEDEEAPPDAPETFSDLDDDELDACICTENEAQTKKAIWDHTHRDYLELQAAKEEAAATLAANPQPPARKSRKRPVIHFEQGATAQESVERMLQSKNLEDRVNKETLDDLFETANTLAEKGPDIAASEPADEEAPMAQHIRQAQETIASTANAKMNKHQAALLREQSALQGGLFESLTRDAAKPKRPLRLGRLR